MKQYKLIKEYPGSPVLDTIIEFNKDAWYAHFLPKLRDDDDLQSIGSKEILSYKEYWQEITKPEYTILSFKQNSHIEDLWLPDYIQKDMWSRNGRDTIPYYTATIITNPLYSIHSVRRESC